MPLTQDSLLIYLLVLSRIAGMLVAAPLFNMHAVPTQSKIGFAAVFAFILFPLHAANPPPVHDIIQFALLFCQETVIGLLLGFTANLTFMAFQMAGEFMSMQMGLNSAQMLDPVSGTQNAIVGQFFFYFAAMVFLGLNIHHALIAGVDRSFNWIPVGHFIGEAPLTAGVMANRCIHLAGEVLLLAMTVGIPIMGTLLVLEIITAYVSKIMPQMNVFMVAIPLKLLLGLFIMMLGLPALSEVLGDQYAHLIKVLLNLYRT